jgi:hypothetical protein
VVLVNVTAGGEPTRLATDLVLAALDAEPSEAPPWRPETAVPADLAPLLGRWWSEGHPFVLSVRAGQLEARLETQPAGKPPAVFASIGSDLYRTVSGREEGELLRVERAEDHSVRRLFWAGYPFTREPGTFGPA